MMKIILLGYMGSGKSTIAGLLAGKKQLSFFDLDQIIEQLEQMAITSIFKEKGEIYFRKTEHQCFKEMMQSDASFVLSLGGGTPCYANNHEFLNGDGIISIYLKLSIDSLCKRLQEDSATRPLISDKSPEALKDFVAQHLFERSYYYNQATHTLNTEGKSPDEIVDAIEKLLI